MKAKLLRIFVIAICTAVLASCSSKKDNDLDVMLSTATNDNDFLVVSVDVERLFEQMEIKEDDGRIELPEYMQKVINMFGNRSMRKGVELFTDGLKGIDYDDALLAFGEDKNGMNGLFVFALDDEDAFISSLRKINPRVQKGETADFKTVTVDDAQILMKDNLAYVAFTEQGCAKYTDAVDLIDARMKAAAANPLASWKRKCLERDNIGNCVLDTKKWMEFEGVSGAGEVQPAGPGNFGDYVAAAINLEGPEIKLSSEMLDKNGSVVTLPYMGKFDTGLMRYAWPGDFMAVSLSMNSKGYSELGAMMRKSISETLNRQRSGFFETKHFEAMADQITRIPEEFVADGGIFASFGFAGGVSMSNTDFNSPEAYHFVVAVDIKPGKISEASEAAVKELVEIGGEKVSPSVIRFKTADNYDYRTGEWVTSYFNINVRSDGNTLVISNGDIKKGTSTPFSEKVFGQSAFAFQILVNDKNPLVSQMGFKEGLDCYAFAKADKSELVLRLTNTKNKFVPAVFGIMTGNF